MTSPIQDGKARHPMWRHHSMDRLNAVADAANAACTEASQLPPTGGETDSSNPRASGEAPRASGPRTEADGGARFEQDAQPSLVTNHNPQGKKQWDGLDHGRAIVEKSK
jgi:hypothetical protein